MDIFALVSTVDFLLQPSYATILTCNIERESIEATSSDSKLNRREIDITGWMRSHGLNCQHFYFFR